MSKIESIGLTDKHEVNELEQALAMKNYAIIGQVGQAIALPSTKDYTIRITIGGFELNFKPTNSGSKTYYKQYGRSTQQAIKLPYTDIRDISKICV